LNPLLFLNIIQINLLEYCSYILIFDKIVLDKCYGDSEKYCYFYNLSLEFLGRESVINEINKLKPNVLFVAMGAPIQEKWIAKNARQISSLKLSIGLGGSLDVWAGKVSRAPKLIQIAGFEWLWRTIKEPKRARIFFDIPVFLFKVRQSKKC
jgi:UDP-N-acetyl-D-mannosaminuronic acid transferase (WecB/TagA/CpsF family)